MPEVVEGVRAPRHPVGREPCFEGVEALNESCARGRCFAALGVAGETRLRCTRLRCSGTRLRCSRIHSFFEGVGVLLVDGSLFFAEVQALNECFALGGTSASLRPA